LRPPLAYAQDSDLTAGRNILLDAENLTVLGNLTISGAVGKYVALGGAVAVNVVANKTEAYVKGNASTAPTISAGGNVAISADDQSVVVAVAGGLSVAVAESGGGAGSVGISVAVTVTDNATNAYVSGSTLTAGGAIEIDASSSALIVSVSVAGSLGVVAGGGGVVGAGAGAVSVNIISNTIQTYITDNSTVTAEGGSALLTAADEAVIVAVGGALSLGFAIGGGGGGGLAVGASVAVNRIENTVESYIAGSTVRTRDAVVLDAATVADVISVTIAGAIGGAGGSAFGAMFTGAGSGSDNRIDNTVRAYISDFTNADDSITRSDVASLNEGAISLSAADNSLIVAVAGSLSFAIAGGGTVGVTVTVGASAANNHITNAVETYIKNSTIGSAINPTGEVSLQSISNASIVSVTIAGAGGGAGGGVGGIVGSGAGSGSGNFVRNTVEASINDGSTVTAGETGRVPLTLSRAPLAVSVAVAGLVRCLARSARPSR